MDKPPKDLTLLVESSPRVSKPEEGGSFSQKKRSLVKEENEREGRAEKDPPLPVSGTPGKRFHRSYGLRRRPLSRPETLKIGGWGNDYLLLEYLEEMTVRSCGRLNLIQKYIGSDGKPPGWISSEPCLGKGKEKARAAVSEMVKELLDLYAARQVFHASHFPLLDALSYKEF